MLAYTCKHCRKIILWGCINEYHEHFCSEKCYLDYCYSNGFVPHTEKLQRIKGAFDH